MLADGSEINWGVWGPDDYTLINLDNSLPESNDGFHWLYMIGSNALTDPFEISSKFSGQATYNWVGGTNFMNDSGAMTEFRITGGQVDVDFGFGSMYFDLATNFTANNLSNQSCISAGCSISDFYFGAISLSDGEGFSGSLGGYFVGDGRGLISAIELWGPGEETYYGTAAFSGSPTPVPDYPVQP